MQPHADLIHRSEPTHWVRLYLAGPVEVAKQLVREFCLTAGCCVTVTPTQYLYTGGEEAGYVVEFVNYPRFPATPAEIDARAAVLLGKLLDGTFQHSALLMTPTRTEWFTRRPEHRDACANTQ